MPGKEKRRGTGKRRGGGEIEGEGEKEKREKVGCWLRGPGERLEKMESQWPLDGARILGSESELPFAPRGKGKETQALEQPEPQHRSRAAARLEPEAPLRTFNQTPLSYR